MKLKKNRPRPLLRKTNFDPNLNFADRWLHSIETYEDYSSYTIFELPFLRLVRRYLVRLIVLTCILVFPFFLQLLRDDSISIALRLVMAIGALALSFRWRKVLIPIGKSRVDR